MNETLKTSLLVRLVSLSCASAFSIAAAQAQDVPIVQPGAPGEAGRELTADEAQSIATSSFSGDDVRFMQDMIPHHQQAVVMANMVGERTNNESIIEIASKIRASQADEIAFMQSWLTERDQMAPSVEGEHAGHHGGHHMATHMTHEMMGMATPEQLAQLEASEGTDFDRLFLQLMIPHHQGAITMVNDLHGKPGSAYDPVLFEFTNDIVADQSAEIKQMTVLLAGLSDDPRVGLAPGHHDAGTAIANLTKLVSLPKPQGFVDPNNPAGLPPALPSDEAEEGKTEWGERYPVLDFANTDMAFSDNILVAGSYHGFNVYELDTTGMPELKSSIVCPGGQGDVSIVGDLLIMSVEQTRGRIDCGLDGVGEDVSPDRFRGLRIFDISDVTRPRQVGLVQTCRGSHTHSIVSANDRRIVVYNSGTSRVRDGEELEGCLVGQPGNEDTALFSIDVIEIPLADPSQARITSSPRVFADRRTGDIAGLWGGGDHGEGTQETERTDQCHDITVFPAAKIAAGACSGNGIILDISNPLNPRRIDDVTDTGFAYWHSATFNNDGTKVLFTDEWGGGGAPRCKASDPQTWGANAIYDIVDGQLEFRSYFKIPAPQVEQENCVAHNGSVVPVPGRDIFVQAWYQGGLSVIDFTDSSNPVEIAYFDRGPIHDELLIVGGYWSTYWYNGKIYGTEIVRGLDVFELLPSDYLTENELAAAKLADMGGTFNPQQQFTVTWPADPVIAHAYLDQLERDGALPMDTIKGIRDALGEASEKLEAGASDREFAKSLRDLVRDAGTPADDTNEQRMAALRDTVNAIGRALR
ncbi:MAG: DUF305 domain-containing protein [Pseudomonadota bacterium]